MPEFIINVREIWTQMFRVEADSKEEAITLISDDQGEEIENTLEYSYTVGSEYWTIEKVNES